MGVHVAAEKVRALAAYIAESKDFFLMSSSDHCAYAFAKQCFGVEHHTSTIAGVNADKLAEMLHIPPAEGEALYCSAGLTRKEAVEYLHALSERV